MPPRRLLKILVGVAVALGGIALAVIILRNPRAPEQPFAKTIDNGVKITLQVSTTTLTLTKADADWTVSDASRGPFKADPEKVRTLQVGLQNVQVDDVISEQGQRASDFEINPESATVITVYNAAQAVIGVGTVGKQANDFAHFYFRPAGKTAIYLAHGTSRGTLAQRTLLDWRDRVLLNAVEDEVVKITLELPGSKTVLIRSSDTWTSEGKLVDAAQVWPVLSALAHLRADAFADPAQDPNLTAAALTYATATLDRKTGPAQILHIGKRDSTTQRYPVSANQDPNVAWVTEAALQTILPIPSTLKTRR